MKIAVVVCSVGRPDSLEQTIPWISRQTKKASQILLVVTRPEDLPSQKVLESAEPAVEVIFSEKGLPRQRNRGLDAVQGRCDAVFFIDDDYLPTRDAIAGIERAFSDFPKASGITGDLIADGIHGAGIPFDEAAQLVERFEATQIKNAAAPRALKRNLVGLYGCNMAYRSALIGDVRFDERLPLYGWQEDVDFASRLPGEKLKTDALVGVHLGAKSGRETSGDLLGYSQVANVAYLMKKGSIPKRFGLELILRNMAANHVKMFRPEPWIDRKARVRGNWMAVADLLKRRSAPERILDLRRAD
ncbi:family 2 glycosyl transferase (plasmid) [Salipiger sp. CCB-MM3]|uniref:glycosyltransferase family 2 protein n=1 Tax=Salipiger sp. CCB-MM3 TaxID=1792508 RepID=UPI00080AA831|nr:glycosyltransferase [Salipiger sp. CCB-MM3]ANT63276.1 family 2 glycosyl transferase [Salipiger sp. CCB-MM3]